MKKCIIALFLVLTPFHPFIAENVDVESARKVASIFVKSRNQLRSANPTELTLVHTAQKETGLRNAGTNYYYVFNVENDNGFIIISGNDMAKPVLGYTTTGKYDPNNVAPGFAYWMNTLQRDIDNAITNNTLPSETIQQSWNAYLNGDAPQLRATQAVTPLTTTKWGVGSPFNLLIPNNYDTGCVATTMAQLMYYYKYPLKGRGIIPAYQAESSGLDIPEINLDESAPYDWNKMVDDYLAVTDDDAKNAVATLMYHCGASVQMDYNQSGSGAYKMVFRNALISFFGYDKSMQAKNRSYYSDQEWENMLRNELNQHRPIYYAGTGPDNSHAFICDGYDDTGLFHFNWGWDGDYDGHYAVSATAMNLIEYSENQLIIMNIFNDAGGTETYEMKLKEKTDITFDTPVSPIAKGKIFQVNATFKNAGANDFSGSYGIVLTNEAGEIIEPIGAAYSYSTNEYFYFNNTMRGNTSFVSPFTIDCAISDLVVPGNYQLKAAVKPQKDGNWIVIDGQPGYNDYLDIVVTGESEPGGTDLVLYSDGTYTGAFDVSELHSGESGTFDFSIVNLDLQPFFGSLNLYIYSEDEELMQVIEENNIQIGSQGLYPFRYSTPEITVPEGMYILILKATPAIGETFFVPSYDENSYQSRMRITVGGDTGINTPAQQDAVIIYPNPVNDQVFIRSDARIYSAKITDLSGKAVKEVAFGDNEQGCIPVNDLYSGNYLIFIKTDTGMVVKKMIKR